jgi:hypothetical protein
MEPLDSGTSALSMAATSFFAQGLYVLWSTVQHGWFCRLPTVGIMIGVLTHRVAVKEQTRLRECFEQRQARERRARAIQS